MSVEIQGVRFCISDVCLSSGFVEPGDRSFGLKSVPLSCCWSDR
jgi:hypothetical protein